MDFWREFALPVLVAAGASAGFTIVWVLAAAKLAFLNKPFRLSGSGGTIRPWPPLWLAMGGFIALICAAGVWATLAEPRLALLGIACLAILAPLALFAILAGLPVSRVTWDDVGVQGPSSSLGFGLRQIAWPNIARIGTNLGGCHFVEDASGGRVFWSIAYIGQHFLWNVIATKRPDLVEQIKRAIAASA